MTRSLLLILPWWALGMGCAWAQGSLVYRNDFEAGAASLQGWQPFGSGPLAVEDGQLTLRPVRFEAVGASLDLASLGTGYAGSLKQSSGPVRWAFQVSNTDGAFNNAFSFVLAGSQSDPTGPPSVGYALSGGGYVGNRMLLWRFDAGTGGGGSIIADIPDEAGLGTLPAKGTFKVTYDPADDRWSVYGSIGEGYEDPGAKLRLLGQGTDSRYTGRSLPFLSAVGTSSGVDRFDNIRVEVVPEPAGLLLCAVGGGLLWRVAARRPR